MFNNLEPEYGFEFALVMSKAQSSKLQYFQDAYDKLNDKYSDFLDHIQIDGILLDSKLNESLKLNFSLICQIYMASKNRLDSILRSEYGTYFDISDSSGGICNPCSIGNIEKAYQSLENGNFSVAVDIFLEQSDYLSDVLSEYDGKNLDLNNPRIQASAYFKENVDCLIPIIGKSQEMLGKIYMHDTSIDPETSDEIKDMYQNIKNDLSDFDKILLQSMKYRMISGR